MGTMELFLDIAIFALGILIGQAIAERAAKKNSYGLC